MKRSYTVELRSAPLDDPVTDELLDSFSEALFADRSIAGAAASADGALNALEVSASVDVAGPPTTAPAQALGLALRAFLAAALRAGVKPEVVSAQLVRNEADEDADRLEIVSGGEVARRLGLSRERVRQLAESGGMPVPAALLGRDRGWRWGDVLDWARLTERRVTRRPRRRSA